MGKIRRKGPACLGKIKHAFVHLFRSAYSSGLTTEKIVERGGKPRNDGGEEDERRRGLGGLGMT